MRILFVLPAPVRVPSGGATVVYRHAQGLVERGHEVTVAAPRRWSGLNGVLRSTAMWVRNRVHRVAESPPRAYRGVRTLEVATPRALDVAKYDSVIATGHQTAPWVHEAMEGRERGGVYFVQGDERYQSPEAEATWSLPFTRVCVSTWLAEVLNAHGSAVEAVIPNAVDPVTFRTTRSLEDREMRIVALYHRLPVKGPDVLIEALKQIKAQVPGVEADIVSARPPLHRLPRWVTVHIRPDSGQLAALYNRAGVCLHTSRLEGWGLVPMEAAACGCATVATASRGVAEYLTDGRSMRQVDVGDAAGLASHAVRLLMHPAERIALAELAIEDVSRFSWADSTDRLETVLTASA